MAAMGIYVANDARKRAFEVAQRYRLSPEMVDHAAIRAARVEPVLRQSQPVSGGGS